MSKASELAASCEGLAESAKTEYSMAVLVETSKELRHLESVNSDMLDALIDMVEHGDATAFKKARAAIQKATGK